MVKFDENHRRKLSEAAFRRQVRIRAGKRSVFQRVLAWFGFAD